MIRIDDIKLDEINENEIVLDETMLKSLEALDKLLETYTKEDFIKEMSKYEKDFSVFHD